MAKPATSRGKRVASGQAIAFGRALYSIRIEKGLSQEELSLQSDVDRSYVGLLERGEKEPCLMVMFRLAEALGTSLQTIIGLTEELHRSGYRKQARNRRVR